MKTQLVWISLLALLASGCSKPVQVEVVKVETRRLESGFSERAETILRRDFPVYLPVQGRIGRIELEPGDTVRKGEVLASFDEVPILSQLKAQKARVAAQELQHETLSDSSVESSELQAARLRLVAIKAELTQIDPVLKASTTELANAQAELARVNRLIEGGALPSQSKEAAQLAFDNAKASLASRKANKSVLEARLKEAKAGIASWQAQLERRQSQAKTQQAAIKEAKSIEEGELHQLATSSIVSPINGTVLAREVRGPQDLPAGTLLLRLGRSQDLEALCEVLSQDAMRLTRGTPVFLDPGSGAQLLHGEVRIKEPLGFTKRSPLGVEQQRVRVRISLLDPPADLGTGYELWARFIVSQKTAPSLPASCFIRQGNEYVIWAVRNNKLTKVAVEIGEQSESYWEVKGLKLSPQEDVVLVPNEKLVEGAPAQATHSTH